MECLRTNIQRGGENAGLEDSGLKVTDRMCSLFKLMPYPSLLPQRRIKRIKRHLNVGRAVNKHRMKRNRSTLHGYGANTIDVTTVYETASCIAAVDFFLF